MYVDIIAGFVVTIVGVGVLLVTVTGNQSNWAYAPGLLLIGVIGLAAACLLTRKLWPDTTKKEISHDYRPGAAGS